MIISIEYGVCIYFITAEEEGKHWWSACMQKHSWRMALSAKPSRSQMRVHEHPACPKHSYMSGHTPVHGTSSCNPTKRAWSRIHGLLPFMESLALRIRSLHRTNRDRSIPHQPAHDQEVSRLVNGTHWGEDHFLNHTPLRSSVTYFQTAEKSICQTRIHSL